MSRALLQAVEAKHLEVRVVVGAHSSRMAVTWAEHSHKEFKMVVSRRTEPMVVAVAVVEAVVAAVEVEDVAGADKLQTEELRCSCESEVPILGAVTI